MDTKSKKWKSAVSFLAFLLGGALLLASIPLGIVGVLRWDRATDAFKRDYRDTQAFQSYMSHVVVTLLSEAEGMDCAMRDVNIRYRVWVDGKLHDQNYEGSLSDGYHFILEFAEGKLYATKDNAAVDVYGDGIYRPGRGWDVPGYVNYPVRREYDARVRLFVAVPDTPVYTVDGDSTLYRIWVELERDRQLILCAVIVPIAGVILFALYLIWRRDKQRADRALARVAGRIWLEWKVLVPVVLLLVMFRIINLGGSSAVYVWRWIITPVLLAILFYLYINDLRYNGFRAACRRSMCGAVARAWRCADLKRPVEQRFQRRALLTFAAMLPFALGTMAWGWNLFRSGFHTQHVVETIALVAVLALLGLLLLLGEIHFFRRSMGDAHELSVLMDQIEAVHAGDFTVRANLPEDADLRAACDQISDLRQSTETALEERTRSERMKVELIANVSHDLKTPLTSIISYTELLSREEGLPDHVKDYVTILGQKSERLKTMVQEVFEVSKAASGELNVKRERIDLCKLLRQTLADMAEPIGQSGLCVRERLPDGEAPILADGDRLYRVFQNLIQNALQYSLPGSRVYITLELGKDKAVAAVRNTSRDELPPGVDFTARFVRGDESRTDGGSGLGLAIARSFTEVCGGAFHVEAVADLFTAIVEFPLARG